MPASAHKTVYPVAKFAFLALLLLLGAILLRLSLNFLHTIILALFLGTVFINFHYFVTAVVRKCARSCRKLPCLRHTPGGWLGKKAGLWQANYQQRLADVPSEKTIRRLFLRMGQTLTGKIQRHYQPPRIQQAREILESRQRFTAGLSVALLVFLLVIPILLFFASAISQGMPFINKGLQMIRSGELQAQIVTFSKKESTKDFISELQNSKLGKFLGTNVADNMGETFNQATEAENSQSDDIDFLNLIDKFIENTFSINDQIEITQTPADTIEESGARQENLLQNQGELLATQNYPPLLKVLERPMLSVAKHVLVILRYLTIKTFATAGSVLFNIFLMIVVIFFVFYKGRYLYSFFRRVSPFAQDDYQQICENIASTSKTVFIGLLGAALIQGLASLLGFCIVRMPAAFFLAVVSSICSIIPFVGTALVWFPVAIYLLCLGQTNAAIFVCAWGILVVGNIDGLVRPWLMSGGKANLSFGVLFFAILGGLQTYGLLGIVYGPILAGIFITCLSIFAQKYKRS